MLLLSFGVALLGRLQVPPFVMTLILLLSRIGSFRLMLGITMRFSFGGGLVVELPDDFAKLPP